MSVDPTRLPYRPCVGAMILNESGNVWIGRRMDARRDAEGIGMWWQMPQGGIDEDEDPRAAAMREVYEETNISSVRIIAQTPGWLTYDLPPELVGVAWKGRYRGQKQRWFAMRFTGADDEIDIRNPRWWSLQAGVRRVALGGDRRVARSDRSVQARRLSPGHRDLSAPGPLMGPRRSCNAPCLTQAGK